MASSDQASAAEPNLSPLSVATEHGNSDVHGKDKETSNLALSSNAVQNEDSSDKDPSGSIVGTSVRRKLTLSFGRKKKSSSTRQPQHSTGDAKDASSKKKKGSSGWAFRLCARTDSFVDVTAELGNQTTAQANLLCVCTGYRRTEDKTTSPSDSIRVDEREEDERNVSPTQSSTHDSPSKETKEPTSMQVQVSRVTNALDVVPAAPPLQQSVSLGSRSPPTVEGASVRDESAAATGVHAVRVADLALALRNQVLSLTAHQPTNAACPYPYVARWGEMGEVTHAFSRACRVAAETSTVNEASPQQLGHTQVHTQIDYIHRLVPDLLEISNCSFYWGKMDRYEAEKLLENKPEGTFLLRDSAQEEHLFSVSFRRFDRSLHARIEQWNHRFSFDSHDPGVFSSSTVCGLIEHYKDPSHCMFFEPMLTIPLHRAFPFSLQHLSRAVIAARVTYDSINQLPLPKRMKCFLKEYHYKQQFRIRRFENEH